MRELTSLKDQQQANRLVAYLAVKAIQATVDDDDGNWVVWIHDDDDRQSATEILLDFQQNPNQEKFENAERKVRHVLREADRLQQENAKRTRRIKKQWGGPWWENYPVTYIMIGICVVVATVCTDWKNLQGGGMGPQLCNDTQSTLRQQLDVVSPVRIDTEEDGHIARYFRLSPEIDFDNRSPTIIWQTLKAKTVFTWESLKWTASKGELWRPIAPIFLHMSILHILFNMMWLKSMGCVIEHVRGSGRFSALCLILAITSNIGQLFWSGPFFGGMSGVVFGLIGYVWMKGTTQRHLGIGLPQQTLVFCILWLVLCMVGVFGPIANAAHLVGFVAGILIGARQAIWKKITFQSS